MKMKSVTLTERQVRHIDTKAKALGVSFSEVLRRILDGVLDKPMKDIK